MTTVRQLITDALRESGILAKGESPDADSFDEGLRKLNTLYSSFFGSEMGEHLTTVNYGKSGLSNSYAKDEDISSDIDSAYIPSNYRVVLNIDSPKTLYLNPNPLDGARVAIVDNGGNVATNVVTVDGNGRQIELADTKVLNTDSIKREWFYRADLGNWALVTTLVADDENPFPAEFDDLFTTMLAFRLNPRYGATTAPETTEVLKRSVRHFKARYSQKTEQDSERGFYALPSTKRYWASGVSTKDFNRGK